MIHSRSHEAIVRELQARVSQQAAVAELGQRALTSVPLSALLKETVTQVAKTLEVDFAKVLERLPDGQHFLLRAGVGWRPGLVGKQLVDAGRDSQAGYTILVESPVIVEDLRRETRFSGPPLLTEHGVVSGVSVIIAGPDKPFGVLGAHVAHRRTFSRDDVHFLQSVANVLAAAIERRRAEQERADLLARERRARAAAESAERRSAFLAAAGAELVGSLDYEAALQRVALLVVGHLADWCVVDIVASSRDIQRVAVARADEQPALAKESTARYRLLADASHPILRVLHTGKPEIANIVSQRDQATITDDPTLPAPLRSVGLAAYVVVPLIARGQTIGAIALVSTRARRRYSPADLALAEELAHRAALAVDNARLYQEAQEAIRLRDDFLAAAAHELKTPLATLKGYIQLLRRWLPKDAAERQVRALEVLERQSDRLTSLVQSLLEASMLENSSPERPRQRFDLGELAKETVARFLPAAARHRLRLELEGRAPVEADRNGLSLVLTRLLSNAVKFSPHGGNIRVRVENDGKQARLSVEDEGVGIPPDRRERLFERFYRAHAGTAYDVGGMGLGLHLSREFIARHGGRLWYSSRDDRGSVFTFTLPLAS